MFDTRASIVMAHIFYPKISPSFGSCLLAYRSSFSSEGAGAEGGRQTHKALCCCLTKSDLHPRPSVFTKVELSKNTNQNYHSCHGISSKPMVELFYETGLMWAGHPIRTLNVKKCVMKKIPDSKSTWICNMDFGFWSCCQYNALQCKQTYYELGLLSIFGWVHAENVWPKAKMRWGRTQNQPIDSKRCFDGPESVKTSSV